MTSESSPLPQFPHTDPVSVPVYNCHILLSPPDESGRLRGRVANLASMEASGSSEREILLSITKQFKKTVQHHAAQGTAIPWVDPPQTAKAGESERFVPVHL